MLKKEMTRAEIEEELQGKGDFVQIDYLTKFLEEKPSVLLKKFVYLKLANIYEDKKMFIDAGKMLENLAVISENFTNKQKYFMKAIKNYIKDGFFEKVDLATIEALKEANNYEKREIRLEIKNFYKEQAQIYENEQKRNNAAKIYEKLLEFNISETEKKEIKKKLLDLYEKLGKFKEYGILEKED